MRLKTSNNLWIIVVTAILFCATQFALAQQLNGDCTVSVLNRNVQVNPDGSWILPNVPSGISQVKARATCIQNGVTKSGESAFFTITMNRMNGVPPILLGSTTQIPASLALTPANSTLTAIGQTLQLTVTATYPDNSTNNVTAASAGTSYTTSNPGIASVNANGLVTAVASGTAVVQAINDGTPGMAAIKIILSNTDSDGDGIPDDAEISLGLDPHNPIDAQEDIDRDGLTNLQEFLLGTNLRNRDTDSDGLSDGDEVNQYHTNPLLRDTDGDGVPDGVEVQTNTNPLDPNSFDLARALRSIEVTPNHISLVVNTIIGEASQQLTVTGVFIDNSTINLTSVNRGTNYNSSNLAVANFGGVDGLVFAGSNGTAIITVTNHGFSATAQVVVSSFAPVARSFISIPGFANNVDISGNFAYVAAGSAGLQVIDVTDRNAPRIIGSLDTPGNANDVRVVGNRAYIADGSAGLQIIDVSNPTSPTLLGALNTPGEANDIVIVGSRAYIADGSAGLQIIDVSNPQTPRLLGALGTPGISSGVDVSGNVAVIADGNSVRTVDVSNPASPTALGSIPTTDARDLTVDGNIAYLADFTGSLKIIDFSTATAPQLLATTAQSLGGILTDVAKARNFVFGADVFFVNGVPITNVSNPANPAVRARLDFPARDDNGTGIAVDDAFIYLTADRSIQENGVNGDSRLYIGQYVALEDRAGIPPVVNITSPATGATVIEGSTISISAQATDDIQVVAVDFLSNGQVAFTDSTAPYQFDLTVPVGVTNLTLGARAFDLGGNIGVANNVQINVIPDPRTTVIGRVLDTNHLPIAGAIVTTNGQRSAITGADGTFSIAGAPTITGNIIVNATATVAGVALEGRSASIPPVAGGTTDVGDINMTPAGRKVGYYDLDLDDGNPAQVAAITTAGLEAVNIGHLATADLSAVQILFIQNPSNGGYSSFYIDNLQKIFDFVNNGGVLVFHDRHVDTAETVLPGNPGIIVRDFADDANINIINNATKVTNGPGGILTDTSLDGGTSSSHGFAVADSIPPDGMGILSRTNPTELVLYSYRYGSGWVVYSSIPLDFYLEGSGPAGVSANFRNIYAPNVVAYAKDLRLR